MLARGIFTMKTRPQSLMIALAGLSLLLITGCQEPGQLSARRSGHLAFNVEWPKLSSGFKLQAIPAETHRIRLSIEGEGLQSPLIQNLTRDAGEAQDRIQIELPAGPKAVKAEAFDAQDRPLAVDVRSVTIVPGQLQRLEMSLQPLGLPTPSPATTLPPLMPGSGSSSSSGSASSPGLLPIPLSPPTTTSPTTTTPALTNTSPLQPAPAPQAVINLLPNTTLPIDTNLPNNSQLSGILNSSSNSSSGGGSSGGGSSSSGSTAVTPVIRSFFPQEGLVGTPIFIEGTNLNKVKTVAFNGVPATFNFETTATGTRIVTTVPLGASTGSISLSTGTTTSASSIFKVLTPVEDLSIDEIFAVNDASSGQYIALKNKGTTGINPSGLYLLYTGDSGSLQSYLIPVGTPTIPAAGSLIVHLDQNGTNSGNHVYTGTSGYEPLNFKPSTAIDIALCKTASCTSSTLLSYVGLGTHSSMTSLESTAVSASKWSGAARSIDDTQAEILTTNTFPGDFLRGILLASSPATFAAGESVVIQDGTTGLKYTSNVAANAGPSASNLMIINPPKAVISSSNIGDGYSSAIKLTTPPPFPIGSRIAIRGEIKSITSISGNMIYLNNPVMRDIAPNSKGSGIIDEIIPANVPTEPADKTFQTNDLVKYKRFDYYTNTEITGAGVGAQRTVTNSSTTGLKIDTPFETMTFSMSNTGSGNTDPVTMSSIPSGLAIGQYWGGKDNQSFKVNSVSGMNVTFNIDFSHCLVSISNTGNGASGSPVMTAPCLGGSVEIDSGALIKTMDVGTPVFRSVSNITGSAATGYSIVFDTPLSNTAVPGSFIKVIPRGGNMELVPSTEFSLFRDFLIVTPRSGDIKLVPAGGAVVRKQALKLGSCGAVPNASCYGLATPSY